MSTNKLTDFRCGEILKGHNRNPHEDRYSNNNIGEHKINKKNCFHITKISILFEWDNTPTKKDGNPFIIYKGRLESTLQEVLFPQPDISLTLSIQR